jgi:hypothetical protein
MVVQRSYIYGENKALKIETIIYLFPKFTRMQETCLTHACLPIFCAHRPVVGGAPTSWLGCGWARRPGPGRRDGRPRLSLTI